MYAQSVSVTAESTHATYTVPMVPAPHPAAAMSAQGMFPGGPMAPRTQPGHDYDPLPTTAPAAECTASRRDLELLAAQGSEAVTRDADGGIVCITCGRPFAMHGLGSGSAGVDVEARIRDITAHGGGPSVVASGVRSRALSLWESLSTAVSWALCAVVWAHLLFIIPLAETNTAPVLRAYRPWYWIPTGLVYLMSLVQSAFAPTRQYLTTVLRKPTLQYVEELRAAQPEVWYDVQNYHYETRTESYTDSKGNRRTRTRQVRVNTHYAKGHYAYRSWRDTSAPLALPSPVPVMSRLRLRKELAFADVATRSDYQQRFASFVAANSLDTHQDIDHGIEVAGFEKYALAPRDPSYVPLFYNVWAYVACSLLTWSPLYRVLFFLRTPVAEWAVEKTVSM